MAIVYVNCAETLHRYFLALAQATNCILPNVLAAQRTDRQSELPPPNLVGANRFEIAVAVAACVVVVVLALLFVAVFIGFCWLFLFGNDELTLNNSVALSLLVVEDVTSKFVGVLCTLSLCAACDFYGRRQERSR